MMRQSHLWRVSFHHHINCVDGHNEIFGFDVQCQSKNYRLHQFIEIIKRHLHFAKKSMLKCLYCSLLLLIAPYWSLTHADGIFYVLLSDRFLIFQLGF